MRKYIKTKNRRGRRGVRRHDKECICMGRVSVGRVREGGKEEGREGGRTRHCSKPEKKGLDKLCRSLLKRKGRRKGMVA